MAVANVYESLDETSIRKMVLPKIKLVFEKNQSDLKIVVNVLQCIERTLDKLDKSQVRSTSTHKFIPNIDQNKIYCAHSTNHTYFLAFYAISSLSSLCLPLSTWEQIIDEVLPLLWDVRLSDPEVILRVVSKYHWIYIVT